MRNTFLQDKAAVVGVGNTSFGALYRNLDPDRSQYDLGAEAFVEALADSGLSKDEIDGVLVCRIPDYSRMSDVLGIRYPSFVNVMQAGGRMASITLQYAAMAVATGQATAVACIYGNNGRSAGARYGGEGGGGGNEIGISDAAYGMTSPGAAVAHMFRRHQYLYGTKVETLGTLAINNRLNAALNPNAVMQAPITMEDYLASRYIAEPLRLLDYCLINDGGVCLIVTSAERARDLKKPPVYIHAQGMAGDFDYQYATDDFYSGALQMVAKDLFEGSEIRRRRRRRGRDLRQLHAHPDLHAGGPRLLQAGRERRLHHARTHRAGRRAAAEHLGRPHERELHAGLGPPRGGGAPGARRVR